MKANSYKTPTDTTLDAIVQALQNLPGFNIYAIDNVGVPVPWLEATGTDIAEELIIRESTLAIQVQSISVKIYEWGRLAARAQRIWEIEQRRERKWKAQLLKTTMAEDAAKPEKERAKWTEKLQEALYRDHLEYEIWKERVERAAEAVNASQAVLEGFRAKARMLEKAIRPAHEAGINPSLVVP